MGYISFNIILCFLGNDHKIYMDDEDIFLECDETEILCEGFCKVDVVKGVNKNICYKIYKFERSMSEI